MLYTTQLLEDWERSPPIHLIITLITDNQAVSLSSHFSSKHLYRDNKTSFSLLHPLPRWLTFSWQWVRMWTEKAKMGAPRSGVLFRFDIRLFKIILSSLISVFKQLSQEGYHVPYQTFQNYLFSWYQHNLKCWAFNISVHIIISEWSHQWYHTSSFSLYQLQI